MSQGKTLRPPITSIVAWTGDDGAHFSTSGQPAGICGAAFATEVVVWQMYEWVLVKVEKLRTCSLQFFTRVGLRRNKSYLNPNHGAFYTQVGTPVTGMLQRQCCFGNSDIFRGESLVIDLFRHMIDNFFICCQFGIDLKYMQHVSFINSFINAAASLESRSFSPFCFPTAGKVNRFIPEARSVATGF